MRLALAVLAVVAVFASTASAADPIVKRVRTSKAQVTAHIREGSVFRGGEDGPPIHDLRCKGYHFNRAHKAKTWRCTYHFSYPGDSRVCTGRYHGGYVRFLIEGGRTGMEWRDDEPDKRCP